MTIAQQRQIEEFKQDLGTLCVSLDAEVPMETPVDLLDPEAAIRVRNARAKDRPRRDTIFIKREAQPNDKDWRGAAPKPMPDRDKKWRPMDICF